MNLKDFQTAKQIEYDREKLRTAIQQLQRPVIVTIHGSNGSGSYLFATIGTGDDCEHPDTNAAALLITQMIMRRTKDLEALDAEFNDL